MPERHERLARASLLLTALLLPALFPAAAAEEPLSEEELFREIRMALVLEGDFDEVRRLGNRYLRAFPEGEHEVAVRLYRAQALAERPEHRGEAIGALQAVIPRLSDPILRDEAWLGLLGLAAREAAAGSRRGEEILARALEEEETGVAVLAGLRVSRLEGPESLRRLAVDRLVKLLPEIRDPDLRDEAILAIIRIDPSRAPVRAGPSGEGDRAGMIHLRVENSCKNELALRVNLPLSFFHSLLDGLGEDLREAVLEELGKELGRDIGDFDARALLDSLGQLRAEAPFELHEGCFLVRLWVE
jgi:hypothetical protein